MFDLLRLDLPTLLSFRIRGGELTGGIIPSLSRVWRLVQFGYFSRRKHMPNVGWFVNVWFLEVSC